MSVLQMLNQKGFHAYDYIITTLTLVKLGAFLHSYKRQDLFKGAQQTRKKWARNVIHHETI